MNIAGLTFPALLMTFAAAGCGLGWIDNQSGGDDHLPTRGAGPYSKLLIDRETPADEPYVVSDFPAALRDPSAVPRDDGGYRLWFGYQQEPSTSASEIWTAELVALTEQPQVGPKRVLPADQAWEQGRVGAPCVVAIAEDHLVMLYDGGVENRAIGRAESLDGGASWEKHADNPVLIGFGEPAVALVPDGDWLLYATRPDLPGIFRAVSSDGISWRADATPVLEPRRDLAEAYDRFAVSNPWLTVRSTAAGYLDYGLFFNGTNLEGENAEVSIGWAGSFDGLTWRRFSSPDEAVLEPGGQSEHGPSVLLEPDRGIMFFSERKQGFQSIAVAVHP